MSEMSPPRSGPQSVSPTSSRRSATLWAVCLALVSVLVALPASAASPAATARRLQKRAMNHDYLETHFRAAEKKLKRAVKICHRGCSTKLVARILRDLATVYIVGLKDPAHGLEAMQNALAADPDLQLDPALTTPDLKSAYKAAGGKGGGSGSGGGANGVTLSSSGELEQQPVTEQRRGTPVPIYVEPQGDIGAKRYKLYYRTSPDKSWHSVHMHSVGDGYGAEIPCDAVNGESVEYYVRAVDGDDHVVASAGSPDDSFKVQLVQELYGKTPHFPGEKPPEACGSGGGSSGGASPAWISLSIQQDFAFVGGNDVCSPQGQLEKGFSCFRRDGVQYHGAPVLGENDKIASGLAPATTRVLLGSDLLLGKKFSAGLRIGYVIQGGSPQSDGGRKFLPLHAAARLSYYFSDGGMNGGGLVPFAFAGGGFAQVDVKKSVVVFEDRRIPPPPNQIDNPNYQTLDAWKKSGATFATLGVGAYWELGHHNGLLGELKFMQLFPSSGTAISVALGYTLGL